LRQGFWDSSISAILSVIDAFWSHDFNFLNFPKTAAGPGASEKALWVSWEALGNSWAGLKPS
jgi:hypothetical protein